MDKAADSCTNWRNNNGVLLMRTGNVANGALIVVCSIAAFLVDTGSLEIQVDHLVLASYSVFLGLLLLSTEILVPSVQLAMRTYFGWLYTPAGRVGFLVFAASVGASFGTTANFLMYTLALLTLANAGFNYSVMRAHPEYSLEGDVRYGEPSDADVADAVGRFLRERPELLAAVTAGLRADAAGAGAGAGAGTGASGGAPADRAARVAMVAAAAGGAVVAANPAFAAAAVAAGARAYAGGERAAEDAAANPFGAGAAATTRDALDHEERIATAMFGDDSSGGGRGGGGGGGGGGSGGIGGAPGGGGALGGGGAGDVGARAAAPSPPPQAGGAQYPPAAAALYPPDAAAAAAEVANNPFGPNGGGGGGGGAVLGRAAGGAGAAGAAGAGRADALAGALGRAGATPIIVANPYSAAKLRPVYDSTGRRVSVWGDVESNAFA